MVHRHVDSPSNIYNEAVGNLGLQTYLKMLLMDNFIRESCRPKVAPRDLLLHQSRCIAAEGI